MDKSTRNLATMLAEGSGQGVLDCKRAERDYPEASPGASSSAMSWARSRAMPRRPGGGLCKGNTAQFPALRLKHRFGGCGTHLRCKISIIHKVLSALLA